jgi:hypothetical protein
VALEDLLKPYAAKVACTDSSGGVACKGGLYRDRNRTSNFSTRGLSGMNQWFDINIYMRYVHNSKFLKTSKEETKFFKEQCSTTFKK